MPREQEKALLDKSQDRRCVALQVGAFEASHLLLCISKWRFPRSSATTTRIPLSETTVNFMRELIICPNLEDSHRGRMNN